MGKVSTKLTIEVKTKAAKMLEIFFTNKDLSRLLLALLAKATLSKGESKSG